MNADLPEKASCACRNTQFGANLVHVAFAGMFCSYPSAAEGLSSAGRNKSH
jgi:hypothetical protein